VELIPACAHDRPVNAPPESCSPSGGPNRAAPPRDAYATARTKPCDDIWGSIPDDTCIPSGCGLNSLHGASFGS